MIHGLLYWISQIKADGTTGVWMPPQLTQWRPIDFTWQLGCTQPAGTQTMARSSSPPITVKLSLHQLFRSRSAVTCLVVAWEKYVSVTSPLVSLIKSPSVSPSTQTATTSYTLVLAVVMVFGSP